MHTLRTDGEGKARIKVKPANIGKHINTGKRDAYVTESVRV